MREITQGQKVLLFKDADTTTNWLRSDSEGHVVEGTAAELATVNMKDFRFLVEKKRFYVEQRNGGPRAIDLADVTLTGMREEEIAGVKYLEVSIPVTPNRIWIPGAKGDVLKMLKEFREGEESILDLTTVWDDKVDAINDVLSAQATERLQQIVDSEKENSARLIEIAKAFQEEWGKTGPKEKGFLSQATDVFKRNGATEKEAAVSAKALQQAVNHVLKGAPRK